jgi:UDP-N-acetylglucosamine acyltransferase
MTTIHETAVIGPNVTIGKGVYIGPGCIIGYPAEDKKYDGPIGSVHIKPGAQIQGNVTIDAGTDGLTTIGENAYIMKGCHIGHDAVLWGDVTLSPHVLIGGRAVLMTGCNLGMGAIVHNRAVLGAYSMIGMGTIVTKKTPILPGWTYVGSPARKLKPNNVGLDRHGITPRELAKLSELWVITQHG